MRECVLGVTGGKADVTLSTLERRDPSRVVAGTPIYLDRLFVVQLHRDELPREQPVASENG